MAKNERKGVDSILSCLNEKECKKLKKKLVEMGNMLEEVKLRASLLHEEKKTLAGQLDAAKDEIGRLNKIVIALTRSNSPKPGK